MGIIQFIVFALILKLLQIAFNALLLIITSPIWITQLIYDKIKGDDRELFDPDTLDEDPEAYRRCFGAYPDELEDWEYV